MSFKRTALALPALLLAPPAALSQTASAPPEPSTLERVVVTARRPSTLPIEIPTTVESITGDEIARSVNATDAEDALKYLPSLMVRKRYIGDYDHAVLATRASGTGNSARSLVFADGILLSNLLGNGVGFTPRWGLVSADEIERVDVLYGPFSAAYSGNSAGAIVDYTTRMPTAFEAHLKLQGNTQRYELYDTDRRFSGAEGSASLGARSGAFSWWLSASRTRSDSQPLSFVAKPVPAAMSNAGIPVTGGVLTSDIRGAPSVLFGTTQETRLTQDFAKLKLAWDIAPTVRATYLIGAWTNDADRPIDSFLRDGDGRPVTATGTARTVNFEGRAYSILPSDFATSRADMRHVMQGLTVKSATGGTWDGELAASHYDYARDLVRSRLPNAGNEAAGRITDQHGTGWTTLAAKGTWRPQPGEAAPHVVEFGLQRDAFRLRTEVDDTADWHGGDAGARFSAFAGDATLTSAWLQDAWRFAPEWRSVLGLRAERWRAFDGSLANATTTQSFAARHEGDLSPKAAVAWTPNDAWLLRAAAGRAVRYPTVSELFQGSIVAGAIVNNDPNLKPERSWTVDLSAERSFGAGANARATLFAERTTDALFSQVNAAAGGTVATIQNVDRVRTRGLELAGEARDLVLRGFSLSGSVTWADSKTVKNDAFPASVGKWQPRVPRWRASLLATYAPDERWSASVGARYSGTQYGQLDNSDVNGAAWLGFSRFFVVDARVRLRLGSGFTVAGGVDNLNNDRYWAFHPYPQRTFHAELRYDL